MLEAQPDPGLRRDRAAIVSPYRQHALAPKFSLQ
jgi:hypothetical protein